jgi:tetratricopeptide (TPR) repeat protein
MTRRWLHLLVLILVLAGVVILLVPAPVDEGRPAVSGQDMPAEPPSTADSTEFEADSAPSQGSAGAPAGLSSSVLNEQAINAWHSGDILNAMTLFEQAIDADPDNPEPHARYGRLLTLMVSYEKALPLLERARDLQPGNAQAWLDLATLHERRQRLEKSWAARAEAAKIVGTDSITRDEQGRFVVAGNTLW